MRKRLYTIAVFCIILVLLTGCTTASTEASTEASQPAFAPQSAEETEAFSESSAVGPSERESSSEDQPDNSSEGTEASESSPEESSFEEETTERETTEEQTSEEETTEEETPEPLTFIPVEETVTATAVVNVRRGHSTQTDILGVLGRGNTVTRIGYHEEWSKVIYEGMECYVSSAYLTTETFPPETAAPPPVEAPSHPIPGFQSVYWDNLSQVTFSGRWFVKNFDQYSAYTTLNAGSEFDFQISGTTSFTLYFTPMGSQDYYFAYSIDGQIPVRQPVSNPVVPLADSGTHTVRIIIDALNDTVSRWDEGAGIAVAGIDTAGGAISPWRYSYKVIGFYGDSITEGIGTLGKGSHSYTNSYTWAYCQYSGAMPVVCAFPGSGATTTGVFNTCANAIQYYSAGRNAADYSPSIIILNHGTNDMFVDSATFTEAYNQTLELLHSTFPDVKIACMIPFSQTHAEDIRQCAAGKDWCRVVETEGWNVTYTDGLHPDSASAAAIGMNLNTAIQQLFS